MTIATLMATAAIFLVKGWTAPAFGALAITIGGVVCIAASNAGDTSQDLKTGYIIGATPWKQQIAIMIGVVVSIFSIGVTLNAINNNLEKFQRLQQPITMSLAHLPDGVQNKGTFDRNIISLSSRDARDHTKERLDNARSYILLNTIGSATLDDGKYLFNPATGQIEIQWIQGIGSETAAAPQGRLMATVINGILSRKLPWALVLLGVAIVIVVELLGVRSLTFAVGAYLSIATTLAIFVGGVVRWLVDYVVHRHAEQQARMEHDASLALWHSDRESWLAQHPNFDPTDPAHADPSGRPIFNSITARDATIESEVSPGSLYASGLIAAGGLVGLVGVVIRGFENFSEQHGGHWQFWRFNERNPFYHDWVSVIMFALLAFSLYYFARKPLESRD
jgi:OPT oligopeptide transporter protein